MREHKPHAVSYGILKGMVPSMRYDGTMPFSLWQDGALKKLNELLGLPLKKCEELFKIEFEKPHDEYNETRFSFQSEEGYFVLCHLLVPKGAAAPLPLMICVQGHSTGMHMSLGVPLYEGDAEEIKANDKDFAVQAVRQGMCAVTIEQRCMGECGGTPHPDCALTAMTDLLVGRTLIGERVWDIQRLIDAVTTHFPVVNADEIYCMGNSGGGTSTFYAACTEKRIKGAMPSCSVCEYEDSITPMRHCTCNYIPYIRNYFEMGDLCGLIAPRKLVIVAGEQDDIFPINGVIKSFDTAKVMFDAAGAKDNCALVVGDGAHTYYQDFAWKAFNKLTGKTKIK